ncbi:MAG: Smr/MutS family protein [Chitinophagaceae bacterium]|nr:Smr/MutS family protein [Chitinophagaceae bacterium]
MKFSEGDKMLIKRTGEEGFVVTIIDNKMVSVRVGKTVFPIHIDEIDHPYFKWFTEKNKENQQKEKKLKEQIPLEKLDFAKPKLATGIHLLFMPVFANVDMEERVTKVKIFAVNHSHFTVLLKYGVRVNDAIIFTHQANMQPFSDIYLHHLDWELMQDIPRFEWELSELLSSQYTQHKDLLKIKSAKLFAHITALQQQNLPTFQYTLLQEFSLKPKEKEFVKIEAIVPKTKQKITSIKDIPKYEVDLHFEALLPDAKGLTNAEILQIQIATLNKYLQLAISNQQDKMVIVHGIGKGVLRNEVIKILKSNEFVHNIESGWQAGYGFGATIACFNY